MKEKAALIISEEIEQLILLIRGKNVMLDRDLAKLYSVETKYLTRQVRRNIDRFPPDFLLRLTRSELANLKRQNGTSSWGGTRKQPLAFTEHGILMLSSVLNSKRAIAVNLHIMRIFTRLRELMLRHKDLEQRINVLEKKYDRKFKSIFEAIRQLLAPPLPPPKPKLPMGFFMLPRIPETGRSTRSCNSK